MRDRGDRDSDGGVKERGGESDLGGDGDGDCLRVITGGGERVRNDGGDGAGEESGDGAVTVEASDIRISGVSLSYETFLRYDDDVSIDDEAIGDENTVDSDFVAINDSG